MLTLALLLVFPLVWPFVAKLLWKHEITLQEMGLNLLIGVVVVLVGWFGGRYVQAMDVEVINGQVERKYSEKVSCEHSYTCNCRTTCTGAGSSKSCSQTCDTCYEHSYDIDWILKTTVGNIEVPRVDSRGTTEPQRFSRALVGDPVAKTHIYTNYVKAASSSLFNTSVEKAAVAQFSALVPAYPSKVFDLHYVNRVLTQGVSLPDLEAWNLELANRLRELGPRKQANIVVLFTQQTNPEYATAVRAAWLGGKKNDVVVVIGAPQYPAIQWVRVVSWTDKELFKVQLRDALLALKTVDRAKVLDTISEHVDKQFVRKQMKDFEYLSFDITPPTWMLVILALVSVGASVGASIWLARENVLGGSYSSFNRRRR